MLFNIEVFFHQYLVDGISYNKAPVVCLETGKNVKKTCRCTDVLRYWDVNYWEDLG
jgi:hypothetical protein